MEDMLDKDFIKLIENSFPEIRINKFSSLDYGWNNHVIVVNDEIVFRIPRNKGNESILKNEVNLLKILQKCPFSIPDYIYLNTNPIFFGGYRMIHGDYLNNAGKLGKGLISDFLSLRTFLDTIGSDDVRRTGLPVYNYKKWVEGQGERIEKYKLSLNEIMPEEFLSAVKEKWYEVSEDMEQLDMGLIHGDLYRKNVIISENHRKIRGIIDWSDSAYGDRALDFAAFGYDFPLKENLHMLQAQKDQFAVRAMKRIIFYRNTDGFYLAHYLAKTGRRKEAEMECRNIVSIWKKYGWY